jgi:hypothetical protein
MPRFDMDKLMDELIEAGCAEWQSVSELAKAYPGFYKRYIESSTSTELAISLGLRIKNTQKRKQDIEKFYDKNNRLPFQNKKCKVENSLATSLQRYCNRNTDVFCKKMLDWAVSKGYRNGNDIKESLVMEFWKINGRLPSRYSNDTNETKLNSFLKTAHRNKNKYPQFYAWLKTCGYSVNDRRSYQDDIKNFYKIHGRLPKKLVMPQRPSFSKGWAGTVPNPPKRIVLNSGIGPSQLVTEVMPKIEQMKV